MVQSGRVRIAHHPSRLFDAPTPSSGGSAMRMQFSARGAGVHRRAQHAADQRVRLHVRAAHGT